MPLVTFAGPSTFGIDNQQAVFGEYLHTSTSSFQAFPSTTEFVTVDCDTAKVFVQPLTVSAKQTAVSYAVGQLRICYIPSPRGKESRKGNRLY
jgi:hypothetical protein